MRRGRSAVPPVLGISEPQPGGAAVVHAKPFAGLPPLDPSPRDVYGERGLLVEQKFRLLSEIHELRSEVSSLGADYQKIVAAYNAQQQSEVDQRRQNDAAAQSRAHADVRSLTARQAALQREDEEHYLMRYFGADAAEQIRVEVAVEKHAVKRMRAQLKPRGRKGQAN
jgi:hypothetical protein